MSKVFEAAEGTPAPLVPGFRRGHLVEAFNTIYTSDAPGAAECDIVGLYPRNDLVPFEEAKLYGHNASHLVLALQARQKGCRFMSEAAQYPELLETTRRVLVEECGLALQRKFAGCDPFFEPAEYTRWAEELIRRMVSPDADADGGAGGPVPRSRRTAIRMAARRSATRAETRSGSLSEPLSPQPQRRAISKKTAAPSFAVSTVKQTLSPSTHSGGIVFSRLPERSSG